MRAVVCEELGPADKLVVKELESPAIKKGHLRVGVHACGVNFPDTLIIQGLYQVKPPLPFTPGIEFAGEVLEVGEGVENYNIGDKIFAAAMLGGYSDELVIPAASAIPMPPTVSYEAAASVPCVYGTSIHALKQRGQLQAGETLLVLGATGGVGMATIQIGKLMGAKVIAAGGSDEKLKQATAAGADMVLNYNNEDIREVVKKATGGKGADVVFDAVGGDIFDQAIKSINWGARYLIIGFASGRIPELAVNRLLVKNASVVGVFWGQWAAVNPQENASNFQQIMQWLASGDMEVPIHGAYDLADVAKAHDAILKREVVGKVVLTTGR